MAAINDLLSKSLENIGRSEPRPPSLDPISKSNGPSKTFNEVLGDAIKGARAEEQNAAAAAEHFVKGEGGIHEVMIAQEKAAIAVRYAVTLKNRVLEAYRELMNTPI
jgi:flagellar hook-basal body complex protein FliE